MKDRATRLFLAAMGVLIVAVLVRRPPATPEAGAEEAAKAPAVLRARAIELVDEKGQVRASLGVEPGGEAVFRMRDAGGTIRVKLGAAEDGSGLLLLDDRTEPAVHLLARKAGTSLVLVEQGKEKRVIEP
jgi:hypothetical protein